MRFQQSMVSLLLITLCCSTCLSYDLLGPLPKRKAMRAKVTAPPEEPKIEEVKEQSPVEEVQEELVPTFTSDVYNPPKPLEVDIPTVPEVVVNNPKDRIELRLYSIPNCNPCVQLHKQLRLGAGKYTIRDENYIYTTESKPAGFIAKRRFSDGTGITAYPALEILVDGKVRRKWIGYRSWTTIQKELTSIEDTLTQ